MPRIDPLPVAALPDDLRAALLATDLEASPLSFAKRALGDIGWHAGSHAPDAA